MAPVSPGRFKASAGDFPGLTGYGETAEQAAAALEAAILKHLASTSLTALESVYEEARGLVPYAALSQPNRLLVATNLDLVLVSEGGSKETWKRIPVTQQASDVFQMFEEEGGEDLFEPSEYSTQIYCLASYAPSGGEAGVYAGTNLKGLVYVWEGEEEWRPAFSTGEERVHALAAFRGALFAGTSAAGRVFRWDGQRSELVHQAKELGITALAVHGDVLYAGTYPEGLILRSEDGELWEIASRTGARMVNQFLSTPDALYAACGHDEGGAVFRAPDGRQWERCFHSPKDVNVYALASFGGRLYAGTGESGRLYASTNGSTWEAVAQSPEAGLRMLASHKGRLYVGTESRGRVYRTASAESPAPTIREVAVSAVTSSRAVLEWSTDAPCEALVQYGAGPARDQTISNATLSRRHRATLEGLKAGTRYTYMIKARSAEGGEAVHLSDSGFTTPVLAAPALVSATHAAEDAWYPAREARVTWAPVPGAARYVARLAPQRITHLTPADRETSGASWTGTLEADGVWWLAVAGVDEAGNVGDAAVKALRCDTAAAVPAVTSPSHPDSAAWSGTPVVQLEAQGTDAASGVEGYLFAIGRVGEAWEHLAFQRAPEAAAKGGEAAWSLPRLPDGTWEIYVRLRDRAGNEGPPASHRVQIDTAPPVVALDPLPAVARAGEIDLAWQAKDDRSGIAKVLVQSRADAASGASWETVYEGKGASVRVRGEDGRRMRYRVVAEDRAGMRGAAESPQAVLFDGSPPEPVTILEARALAGGDLHLKWGPARDAFSETARYVVHRSEAEGRLGMRIGTVPATVLEYVDDGTALAHGTRYWYRIGSEDAVGNLQTEGVSAAGTCDKEAPPPVLRSRSHPPGEWTTLTEAEIEWDTPADESGVAEYVWRLDRNPASTLVRGVDGALAAPPLKLARLADGVWYAHVATVDGAGNVSSAAHYALRVVTRPPHARLSGLPSTWNQKKIRLAWQAEEGVIAVSIGVREGGAQEWTVAVERAEGHGGEVEIKGQGVYEFSIRAQDAYGRTGVWEEGVVTLVDLGPPLEVPALEAKTLPGGRIRVQWEPSWDELSGLAQYRIRRSLAGGTRSELLAEIPATEECAYLDECEGIPEGTRLAYAVWPEDLAGNVLEASPLAEAVCDRSAPAPALASATHPDPARAYPSRRLEATWTAQDELTGVAGVVAEVNALPGTHPNPETLPVRAEKTLRFDLPEDGHWTLHVRTVDGAGNASETAHFPVQVDTRVDPPVASFVSDPFLEWKETGSVSVALKAPPDESGVPAFWYLLNQRADAPVTRETGARHAADVLKVSPPGDGLWHLHVAAEDGAGNLSAPAHLTMRLTTGLAMPRMRSSTHPEGIWSRTTEVEMAWEPVEGEHVSYLYWLDRRRQDAPPGAAMRASDPACRVTIEQGVWYWHVCAVDERGRKSTPLVYQLRADASPPSIAVASPSHPSGAWSGKRRVAYAIEAADGESGIARVELAFTPAGREPDVWELALGLEGEREAPGEGLWTLWARAVDLAGNVSPLASADVLIDTEAAAPGITSATHPDGRWSAATRMEVVFQPGEDLSGVAEYAFMFVGAGEDVPAEPPPDALRWKEEIVRLDVPGEGRWTLAAWATDRAGNVSPPARAHVWVDGAAAPPSGFVVEPSGEGGWLRSGEAAVFWKEPEEVSGRPDGYWWKLDREPATLPEPGGANFAAFPELEIGDLDDGIWHLHVRTVDAAGNLSAEAAHVKLAIDRRPPDLLLAATTPAGAPATEGWLTERRVTIEAAARDEVSGVTGCFWTMHHAGEEASDITAGSWREEPSWTVDLPWDGEWVIAVAAQDGAGNHSEPATVVVRVDTGAEPPRNLRSPSHPDAGEWSAAREVVLDWEAPEEAAGVKAYRWSAVRAHEDSGDPAGWAVAPSPPLAVPLSGDGEWELRVVTEDGVGHLSAPAELRVRVDSEAARPVLDLLRHPNPEVWYADTAVEVAVEAADEASGIASVLLGHGPDEAAALATLRPASTGVTTVALARGAWTIAAVAVDSAGNRSAPVVRRVRVDPAVRPPLLICQSHPDPDAWYPATELRFSVMPAEGGDGKQDYWMVLDDKPNTQPAKPAGFAGVPGPVKVSAPGSGEWWLHVVSVSEAAGFSTQAAHVRARVDQTIPPAPEVRSRTHPPAPRRTRAREAVFEWAEPSDPAGIREYQWVLSRQSLLGLKREKSGAAPEPLLAIAGLEPGSYELAVLAVDGAGHQGPAGRYAFFLSDTQDVCVAARSESWRVARAALEVEIRSGEKLLKRAKTDGTGEAWFKDMPYEPFTVVLHLPKPNPPLVIEGVAPAPGEAHLRFEATLAGCAWAICGDTLRLWVPEHWRDGGRVEVLGEKGPAKGVHALKDLPREGTYLACPLPPDLLAGRFQLMGGPLAKLDWPPLPFKRLP